MEAADHCTGKNRYHSPTPYILCPLGPHSTCTQGFCVDTEGQLQLVASRMAIHGASTCTIPSRHASPAPKIQGSTMMGLRSRCQKRPWRLVSLVCNNFMNNSCVRHSRMLSLGTVEVTWAKRLLRRRLLSPASSLVHTDSLGKLHVCNIEWQYIVQVHPPSASSMTSSARKLWMAPAALH